MNYITKDLIATDEQVIEKNERWFNWYLVLPKLITIILGILFFIAGIIVSAYEGEALFLAVWAGGAAFCAVNYLVMKIILSYKILHIYYLKKISLKNEKSDDAKQEEPDALPEI